MMETTEQQCHPGQIHALHLKRGSILVAKTSALHIEYRDSALDWLLDAAPAFSVELAEGAQYILPCDAFVKLQTHGPQTGDCMIMFRSSRASQLLAWINQALLHASSPHVQRRGNIHSGDKELGHDGDRTA